MTNYITQVTLPDGEVYNVRDAEARNNIAELQNSFTSALRYRGITKQENLVDGAALNTLSDINAVPGTETAFRSGDVVLKLITGSNKQLEFIYDGSKWSEFGSSGSLGSLAFANKVVGTETPSGIVGENLGGTIDTTPQLKGNPYTFESVYTPRGTVTVYPENNEVTVETSGNLPNEVRLNFNGVTTATYQPGGKVSKPDFHGTEGTVNVQTMETTSCPNYTPAGTILCNGNPATNPSVNVELNTGSVESLKTQGTLPSLEYEVEGEELKISWDKGKLPLTESKSFATSVKSASVGALTFRGNGARISGTYKPAGTIDQPTFTGTAVTVTAGLAGSAPYTFSGTVTTDVTATASFNGTERLTAVGTITPSETNWYIGELSLAMNPLTVTSTASNI